MLDEKARRYHQRPAALLMIEAAPLLALWLDDAAAWFGKWVEARLSEKDEHGRPLYELDGLLGVRQYATYKRE